MTVGNHLLSLVSINKYTTSWLSMSSSNCCIDSLVWETASSEKKGHIVSSNICNLVKVYTCSNSSKGTHVRIHCVYIINKLISNYVWNRMSLNLAIQKIHSAGIVKILHFVNSQLWWYFGINGKRQSLAILWYQSDASGVWSSSQGDGNHISLGNTCYKKGLVRQRLNVF